jgi:DNA-binding transcriptional regulator YhcF (GntR family)
VTGVTSAARATGTSAPRLAPLQTIEPVSAVSAVTRRLLDFFTSGEIAAGDRLPAERQLAAQLGVGRSAVREALAALELLGIVSVRTGSGTYLKGSVSELLPQTLSWGHWLGEPKTVELIQVRQVLEVQVARLAAELASDEEPVVAFQVLGSASAAEASRKVDIAALIAPKAEIVVWIEVAWSCSDVSGFSSTFIRPVMIALTSSPLPMPAELTEPVVLIEVVIAVYLSWRINAAGAPESEGRGKTGRPGLLP